jgi:hypothetical protein
MKGTIHQQEIATANIYPSHIGTLFNFIKQTWLDLQAEINFNKITMEDFTIPL